MINNIKRLRIRIKPIAHFHEYVSIIIANNGSRINCPVAVLAVKMPTDKDGMRVDILQNLCDKHKPKIIYTIPTFHDPTGAVMTLKRRRQILDIAHRFTLVKSRRLLLKV
jgi:hypothetical protein